MVVGPSAKGAIAASVQRAERTSGQDCAAAVVGIELVTALMAGETMKMPLDFQRVQAQSSSE